MKDRYSLPSLPDRTWEEITAYQIQSMHEADTVFSDIDDENRPAPGPSPFVWYLREIFRNL